MNSERLTEQSNVRMTNEFSTRSSFENIHSYRVVMSFLGVVDFNFPDLEGLTNEEVIKFFNARLAEDSDYLTCEIDYYEFSEAWQVKNPKSNKQSMKKLSKRFLIQSAICEGATVTPLFNQATLDDNIIKVHLNARAMPYLLNAHRTKKGFISPVPIKYFQLFRSTITAKLFERMLQFVDTGVLIFTIDSLRELTGTKSLEYKAIKRDVLNKAKSDFESFGFVTKFSINEEKYQRGRKARGVKRVIIHYEMPEILALKKQNIEKKKITESK